MARIGRSIWAVVAGFLSVMILSIVTDFILETAGVFPPASEGLFVTWMLVLALVYRSAYAVLGGYITAKIAPHKPMKHVWILSIIGEVFAILGIFANLSGNLGPNWYPIMLAILTIPCVVLGGKLRKHN
jgi:hypothetical protein